MEKEDIKNQLSEHLELIVDLPISIGEMPIATIIYNDFENLQNSHDDDIRKINIKLDKLQQDFGTQIKDIINENNEKLKIIEENRRKMMFVHNKIFKIRQAMNELFQKKWRQYDNVFTNVDFDILASKTSILKRKTLVKINNGIKFALIIINGIDKTINFPIELCKYYITLNNKFHPDIRPIQKTIIIAEEMKKIIVDNDPQTCQMIDATPEVLKEFIEQLKINEHLF